MSFDVNLQDNALRTLVLGKPRDSHAFSKQSLVNFISKDVNLLFSLSVYLPIASLIKIVIMMSLLMLVVIIEAVIKKVQRHDDLIKADVVRTRFISSECNNAVSMRGY